ncbi:hypothetical protein [Actinoplanes sp. NBRC 101535]|uniref:hypothetical protein n=1 Tax=Actinoplanes sp. NBRC 101535 TaxID=3032196 RepID=UPI0024A5A26B|nr:hypothetical protein [Actinoplanes sp. NBRC 101535]GLY07633.1 hypothetical protein Acsp01_80120 [Actinoplanes sp. NBRC 101535]
MADPLTLTVLGAVAATEGIKFLYGQASEVLTAWRERGRGSQEVSVPFIDSACLDETPAESIVDMDVITAENQKLIAAVGALHPYAADLADVDLTDEKLAQHAGDLRALLEAAYGYRLTFAGEEREPTGASVNVQQILDSVSGKVVGAESELSDGTVAISQRAKNVDRGGSLTGFKGRIGK